MHVLIETFGSAGDVLPFTALGGELARRGHRVEVHTSDRFRETVRLAGLEHVSNGTEEEYREAENDPRLWHPRRGVELIWELGILPRLRERLQAILDRQRDDTVMIGPVLGIASRMARELRPPSKGGAPLVTAHLAPSAFFSVHRSPRFPGLWMPDGMPKPMKRGLYALVELALSRIVNRPFNRVRAEVGLPPVERVFERWIHSPDRVLGFFPEWFGPPQLDWPTNVELTGFVFGDDGARRAQDERLEDWLEAGAPPIVAVAGSANVSEEHAFHRIVAAARRLRRRALLVTRNERALPQHLANDDVLRVDYAPFDQLLPRAAALVSHGGIGTTAQALRAGIPHLVQWRAYDQLDNASRLEDLGVGLGVNVKRAGERTIERALARLLDDATVAEACRRHAARIDAAASMRTAADQVERVQGG